MGLVDDHAYTAQERVSEKETVDWEMAEGVATAEVDAVIRLMVVRDVAVAVVAGHDNCCCC